MKGFTPKWEIYEVLDTDFEPASTDCIKKYSPKVLDGGFFVHQAFLYIYVCVYICT